MFFWALAEPILMILAALCIFTQIMVPAWRGTPTFPLVRKAFRHRREMEEKVHDLRAAKEGKVLEKQAKELEQELQEDQPRRPRRGPKKGGGSA